MQLGQGMDGAGQTLPPWAAVKHSRRAPGAPAVLTLWEHKAGGTAQQRTPCAKVFACGKGRLNGAYRAAPSQMGPQWPTARQETDVFLLVAYTLPNHGVGHFEEAGDVGSGHQIALHAVLGGRALAALW